MQQHIVVEIDRSRTAERALSWAAAEARRKHAPLLVVHAVEGRDRRPPAAESDLRAERLLTAGVEFVAEQLPTVRVAGLCRTGKAADLLVELSRTALMVVVGTRGRGRPASSFLGSVSQRTAAGAYCPVVIVDQGHAVDPERHRVVVGVSGSATGLQALRFAFAEALERHAKVVAVRSFGLWGVSPVGRLPGPGGGLLPTEAETLDSVVDFVAAEFPGVALQKRLVDAPVFDALPAASRGADVLVIGCRRPDSQWPSRLGGVAAGLLHRSRCPVVVVGLPAPAAAAAS